MGIFYKHGHFHKHCHFSKDGTFRKTAIVVKMSILVTWGDRAFDLLPIGTVGDLWDGLWLELWPFLCFMLES